MGWEGEGKRGEMKGAAAMVGEGGTDGLRKFSQNKTIPIICFK